MKKILSAVLLILIVASPVLLAEELIEGWRLELTPYLWGVSIDGESGIGDVPLWGDVTTDVDMSFSDILSNLDSAFLMAFSGSKGPWDLWLDANYLKLKEDSMTYLYQSKTEMNQLLLDAFVSYHVGQTDMVDWYVHGGLRYADVETEVRTLFSGPVGLPLTFNVGDKWYDPIIGARAKIKIDDQWSMVGRGEVGGFGMGSDLTWLVSGSVTYQIDDMWSVKGMYRVLDIDYNDSDFINDVTMQGLALGFGVAF